MTESSFTPRFGAGVWLFGRFIDRYATDGYGPAVGICEAIRLAGEVEGLEALDLNFPFWDEGEELDRVREALSAAGLRASAITPEIYTRKFRAGGFTNPDAQIRREAQGLVARATEVAYELAADYVKLWPGQDGHDYPFQADHARLWSLSLEGVRTAAEPHPEMRFAIEYKPKEPRIHMLFANAATTLLAIDEIGLDNVGILLDFGHSLNAGETPAAALQMVLSRNRLLGIDFNDNFRGWDDDLAVGAVHPIETLEFLHVLRASGWEGLWQLDQFPFREDPVTAARTSIRVLTAMNRLLDRIDVEALRTSQASQDALAAQRIIYSALLADELQEAGDDPNDARSGNS
jgi:xylose isomerase